MKQETKTETLVLDADNAILGRISTYAAKQALLGKNVKIINCEKAVISGRKSKIFKDFKAAQDRGTPKKGPFISRIPDRYVRRTVRGMLKYKKGRGKEAYKRVMCYIGAPENMKGERIKNADASKLPNRQHLSVGDLCKLLGWKG